jgi:hypothetical protein
VKRLLLALVALAALCSVTSAQQPSEPPSSSTSAMPAEASNKETRIAPGSVIPVELKKTIDAKKIKTGDQIEAIVTQDLKAGNGEVIMPKDTKVLGHVTEAQARNKDQKESQVGIAFDQAALKNGDNLKMPMSIQAVIVPAGLSGSGNSNGQDNATQTQTAPGMGGTQQGAASGRNSGMSTGPSAPTPSLPNNAPGNPSANTHQPITGNTEGVIGISNLSLSAAANPADGSVLSSDKSNVKLESGTMLLLRVRQ